MSSAEAWQQEKEFLDYMFVSLHGGGSGGDESESGRTRRSGQASCGGSTATVSNKSPVKTEAPAGLDHLDNLCKLMEQLGELRDANSRLQKRVQYLEDMKTLQEMHQELDLFVSSDSATTTSMHKTEAGPDRSLDSLDSGEILQQTSELGLTEQTKTGHHNDSNRSSNKPKIKSNHHMKFKKPTLLKYRERSKSVGFDETNVPLGGESEVDYVNTTSTTTTPSPDNYKMPETNPISGTSHSQRPVTLTGTSTGRTKTKVSKWTRVKEAFRWEKAHVDASVTVKATTSKHPDNKEEALSRHQVNPVLTSTLAPEIPGHAMAKSPSPVFRLGRRRRSTSRTSTSSSSLSECPLESEILKSFADAQELPLFRLDKRASSPEVKLSSADPSEEETGGLLDLQRGSVLSLPQMKRLHRQSTVSCDGNFATSSPTVTVAQMPVRIPEGAIPSEIPVDPDQAAVRMKGPESPNRRKISKNSSGHSLMQEHQLQQPQELVQVETDESGSFISNLRSQLKPINEWTSKWTHCDIMKNSPVSASPGAVSHVETSSRNSLSVPSTPNQHQAFTFDEFPESGPDQGASRENSPGSKKHHDLALETAMNTMTPFNSTTIKNNPGLLLNSISPEFRKKVEVWERLKSGLSANPSDGAAVTPPTPTTPHQHGKKPGESPDWNDVGKRRSEPDKLPPAFKKKLAEWEIRKAVAGKSDQNVEELHKILPHDFNRKLQEWERMKQQQAAAGKMSVVGNQSGQLERQGSGKHHQRGKHVKSTQKTEDGQHRGEKQKEKDLQWLEKELQKIEREKLRLEREREKYIERESRLEKIREAMKQPGHGPQREICIRTSTGEFRFQGLSRKFTKKLFQWEEQKGIRPEASTIALLDGAFSPSRSGHHHLHHHHPVAGEFPSSISTRSTNLSAMSRSKSESSVADLVSASVHSQPSSLSLNDAETTTEFDRRLAGDQDGGVQSTPGPGALLVEVEDVTDECAAVVDIPEVQPQAPIYSIAPAELRQTIHRSEQEDQPRYQIGITGPASVQRNDSVRTEASFKLLEENLSLLDRLRAKGEIVKYLELQMTSLDGDMAGVANTQTEEMDRLKEEVTCLSDQEENAASNSSTIDRLKKRIVLLENRGQQLKSEKEHLHVVYQKQCDQQANLVQHLIDKMQQLRSIGSSATVPPPPFDSESLERLDTLTTEILHEAQTLENSIRHPQRVPTTVASQQTTPNKPTSFAVKFPERLSVKANQLKEEYERLRSFDSEGDANSDDETEVDVPAFSFMPQQLPPIPSEMSMAAQKKIFVETRTLVFAPLDTNVDPATVGTIPSSSEESQSGSAAPWRRIQGQKDQSSDAVPWRKNSLTATTEEGVSDQARPPTVTTVRNTAPNIRRMIDKYHQKVTASGKDRSAPAFHFRPKCDFMIDERSSSSTPPPLSVVKDNKSQQSPPTTPVVDNSSCEQVGLLHLTQLSKSQSTGAMGDSSVENQRTGMLMSSGWSGSGVLRSKSGLHMPTSQVSPCARNPSFFRKSPLDPSIDDLLLKYRGRRQVDVPAELPRSPTCNPERMLKLKQAREAFLTIGPGAIQSDVSNPSEELAHELPPTDEIEQPPSTPSGSTIVVPDITFDACSGDSGSCRSQEGSVKSSTAWPGSAPSSPAIPRRPKNDNRRGGNPPHPLSRHSWLKQPSKFFFPKPKSP